ncbi:ketopantoate reductase family protein [Glaciihabitans sp. dw_435]|uniref:ketopantoate reductase family protein n=1 Tax=Glaciihabitans sp. dw_435 TaxID=2720081 RepID=UPI001BD3DF71|nr:2-dehydropantoate 2-reductase N-terminal domain-containing protein [Glaciihabitans sp. dw_435]
MKILVYGAGVLGSIHAVRLYEAGVDVTVVARASRLASIRENGVLIAEGDHGATRSVAVPVTDNPSGHWDLILVFVRTHQVDAVLHSLAGQRGDVLLLVNWAAGPAPLGNVVGHNRVLLGFPTQGGVMDGDVVRYRPETRLTRLAMPIGEPDGRTTQRLERIVEMFRSANFAVAIEPRMDAWLRTHAAFEVPLGLAVHAAGGPEALAQDRPRLRSMVHELKRSLAAMPNATVPRPFGILSVLPAAILVPVFRLFLRSSAAGPLRTDSAAVSEELECLAEQLRSSVLAHSARLER